VLPCCPGSAVQLWRGRGEVLWVDSEMSEDAAPTPGQDYKLELGASFLGKRNADEYCTFRFGFKPKSAGTAGNGVFQLDRAKNKVS